MSKAELLQEVAKLSPKERDEVWEALCSMEETHLLQSSSVSESEKAILDAEMREYQANPIAGKPWSEVKVHLSRSS